MKKSIIIVVALTLLLGGVMYNVDSAEAAQTLPTPEIIGTPAVSPLDKIAQTGLDKAAQVMMIVAVGVLMIALIWGAIRYMTAGGNEDSAKTARTIIFNGVIGAIVLFALGFLISLAGNFVNDILLGGN